MNKQVVVRTHPKSWSQTTYSLQKYLNDGYKVVHVTPLENSITEYILEKQDDNGDVEDKRFLRESLFTMAKMVMAYSGDDFTTVGFLLMPFNITIKDSLGQIKELDDLLEEFIHATKV